MQRKKQPLISLCLITKDEEFKLPGLLKSLKEIVDEIIVVDTGSTDNTIKVAEQLGAIVYLKEWNNDFSLVRNYAIEKATGKWILFLDADETISSEEAKLIPPHLKNPMVEGYLFYINTFLDGSQISSPTQSLRLFRNRKKYRYKNRIYERIPEELIANIKEIGITIQHHPDEKKQALMQQLKLKLLEKEIEDNPTDSYLHYVYGIEQLNKRNYMKAIECFQEALKYVSNLYMYCPHLYKLLTWSLICIKDYEKAIDTANQGMNYFPFYTDLLFLRGKSNKELKKYHNAIGDFNRCQEFGDAPPNMVAESALGGYKSLFELGQIHEELLNIEKALAYYKQTNEQEKNYRDCLYLAGHLIKENPVLGEIDANLLEWLNISDADDVMILIDILCIEADFELALDYIVKIETIIGMKEDVAFVKGICYMMLNKMQEADKYFLLISNKHPYYEQVLLRRIQNFWFNDQWENAMLILNEITLSNNINDKTKDLYKYIHAKFTNVNSDPISLSEEEYQIVAKVIERMIILKQDNDKINVLLNLLIESKNENLLIKIGEKLAKIQDVQNVLKISEHIQDRNLKMLYNEKVARKLFNSKNFKLIEQLLPLNNSSEFGVEGYYIWSNIWLLNTLNIINSVLRSKKINQETKKIFTNLKRLIINEN